MHLGIDVGVSQHPGGAPIDWAQVYAALKAEGGGAEPCVFVNSRSPYFAADVAAARAAGFTAVGVYDYYQPAIDAAADEAHFRAACGNLPGALDLEETDGLPWSSVAQRGQEWEGRPAEAASLLYSNLNFLTNMAGAPWSHPIWFAGTVDPATNPVTRGRTVIWQYGVGPVPGIAADTDLDRWVGTEDQFSAFFGLRPPAPPAPAPPAQVVQLTATEEPMQRVIVTIGPLDTSGCGSVILDGGTGSTPGVTSKAPVVASDKVVAVGPWGSDPAADGFYARHQALWQDRGGHPLVTITGGPPKGQATAWLTVST